MFKRNQNKVNILITNNQREVSDDQDAHSFDGQEQRTKVSLGADFVEKLLLLVIGPILDPVQQSMWLLHGIGEVHHNSQQDLCLCKVSLQEGLLSTQHTDCQARTCGCTKLSS